MFLQNCETQIKPLKAFLSSIVMAIECWNSAVMLTRVANSWRFQNTMVATNVATYEFQRGHEGLGGQYSSSRYTNRS
jgi:hypothetical protein